MTGGCRAGRAGVTISPAPRTERLGRGVFRELTTGRYAEGLFAFLYSLLLVLGSAAMVALSAPPLLISAVDVLCLPLCAWTIQASLRRIGSI